MKYSQVSLLKIKVVVSIFFLCDPLQKPGSGWAPCHVSDACGLLTVAFAL